MAAISRSRRSASGIALIVAGAAFVVGAVLPFLGFAAPWLYLIAYAAFAVALVILGLGAVTNVIERISLFAGAVGWLLLAISGLGLGLPAAFLTAGAILAALGTLIGAIVLYTGKELGNTSAGVFVIAALLALVFLLTYLGLFSLGALSTLLVVALGVALVITGVYFRRTERKR